MNAAANFTPSTSIACPCCGKTCKVTKAGKLSNHGYSAGINYSWTAGKSCPASGASSEREALNSKLEVLRAQHAACLENVSKGYRAFAMRDMSEAIQREVEELGKLLA